MYMYVTACTEFYGFNINKPGLSFKLAPAPRPCVFPGKKSKIDLIPGWNVKNWEVSEASLSEELSVLITFIRQRWRR